MRIGDNLFTRLLYRLHRVNPIVAQVEAEAAIGSSHHFTIGGELLVHPHHPELVVSW